MWSLKLVDLQCTVFPATQFWRKKIAAVANKYPAITFAVADDEANAKMLEGAGLGESGEELNVLLLGADGEKFPMEPMEEYDSDDLKEFLDKYKKGLYEAWNFKIIILFLCVYILSDFICMLSNIALQKFNLWKVYVAITA